MENPTEEPRKRRIMSNETLSYYQNARELISKRMRSMDGIGDRLKSLREGTDPLSKLPHYLTKTQVSEFLGITGSNISRYEEYPHSPTSTRIGIDMLVFLSTLYGVPMEYIMYGTLPSYVKIETASEVEETEMAYVVPNVGQTVKDIVTPIGKKLGRKPTQKEAQKQPEPKEDDLVVQILEMQKKMAEISEEILKRKKG